MSSTSSKHPAEILLVEDDDGHAELISENLRAGGVVNSIRRARDGQEALDYIHGTGPFVGQHNALPLLILLDINMPRVDGVEVLRELKSDSRYRHVPIIMLTTIDNPKEVERCYEMGCNTYITKPVAFSAFAACVRQLGLFAELIMLSAGADQRF